MAKKELPSPEVLRQLLQYQPETGKLFWKERGVEWFEGATGHYQRRWNTRYAGTPALNSRANRFGHLGGTIFNKSVHAHRVIWAILYGEWPVGDIDHINGDPRDNRVDNLRSVSRQENTKNRAVSNRSKSGHIGVSPCGEKWQVNIKVNGNPIRVGNFRCLTAAIIARRRMSLENGFHENHGRPGKKVS